MGSIRRMTEMARREAARLRSLKEMAEAEKKPAPKPVRKKPEAEEKKPPAGLKEKVSSMIGRKSKKKDD